MRNIKIGIIALFCLAGILNSKAQNALTLEKALEIAYANSPTLIQSKMSLEQRQLNLVSQKASLKSQFSLSVNPFTYSRQNTYDSYNSTWYSSKNMGSSASFGITQPIKWTDGSISLVNDFSWQDASNKSTGRSSTSFNHDVSLRLSQPIFTYNRTKMNLKELEFSLEQAEMSYTMQHLNIEKNVTQQFYNVYKAQKDLLTTRQEYESQKQNYDIVKNKVESGLLAKGELFQAEVNLATSESSVTSQEISFENTKDNFKVTLGMDLNEDFTVIATEIDTISLDVNQIEAVNYALAQRTEIRQHEITLEQDLFSIIQAKASSEFKGDISLRVGLNALGNKVTNMYDNPTDNEQIGISLTIPIFDWGAKKARVKSSQIARESDEINMNEEKKTITLSVRQICRNLPTLKKQIEIKKKSMENAALTYDINEVKYRNGDITGMDLQQYQTQLTTARQAYTNAIIEYRIEILNLKIQTLWDFETGKSVLPESMQRIKK